MKTELGDPTATVACLASKRRCFLGVGTGKALNEYSATAQWPSYKSRQAQTGEAVELIRALWSDEKTTYKGAYYQTREAKLYTRPRDPITLYLSTMVPGSAHFAGKHGDGLITIEERKPKPTRIFLQTSKQEHVRQVRIRGKCRRNSDGVVLHLRSVSQGARLQLGTSGLIIKPKW